MVTTAKPDLEKLRALAEGATPGPWHHNNDVLWSMVTLRPNGFGDFICSTHRVGAGARDDAAFIAAARTAVPWLLDRVDELERELAEWADWAKLVGEISAEQVGRGTSVEQANRRAFHVAEERDELRVELADERRKREELDAERFRLFRGMQDQRDAAQRENARLREAMAVAAERAADWDTDPLRRSSEVGAILSEALLLPTPAAEEAPRWRVGSTG